MRALLIMVLFVFALPGVAQTNDNDSGADTRVRTFLEPEGDYYVGQLIRFWVEITTTETFQQAPRYPDLKLDGAIAVMPEQLGVNFSSQQKGKSIIGQRQRYAIIPQRAGEFIIPELKITYSTKNTGKESGLNELVPPALKFESIFPPGVENVEQLVSTTNLSVNETYSQQTDDLKVGDAVTRKITVTADNMLAVALPEIQFEQIAGTSAYPAQPQLSDDINRGKYFAKRTDSASYIFEKQGTVNFPEIKIDWWNLETRKLETIILPEVSFDVAVNPEFNNNNVFEDNAEDAITRLKNILGFVLEWIRLNVTYLGLAALTLYLLLLSWRKYGQVIIHRGKCFWQTMKQSEWLAFVKFRYTLRFGNRTQACARFWQWLDLMTPSNRVASLTELAKVSNDEYVNTFIEEFEASQYSPQDNQQSSFSQLDRRIRALRKHLLTAAKIKERVGEMKLNP